ncbi:MAG: DsrE family protein [Gammaproteobacteria bacterium]|nr:DsrE family protein [Gammaproteobacteria bacterium]
MNYLTALLLLVLSFNAYAFEALEDILKLKKAPAGVVIEITSGDKLYLEKIMPQLKADILAIQKKHKGLSVAIVSHARESLLLTKQKSQLHTKLHSDIKSLSDNNTSVHVCGTYASWFNINEDEFPDYINVSPAGPVQVDDYLELGYLHIEL